MTEMLVEILKSCKVFTLKFNKTLQYKVGATKNIFEVSRNLR